MWLLRPRGRFSFWFLTDSGSVHTYPWWGGPKYKTLPCRQFPEEKQVALTFIKVAEKRTLIVAKVGFDATSPRICLASQ